MLTEKNYEILSQFTGDFIGGCEILEDAHFAELWDADGKILPTYIAIDGLSGDDLYRTIIEEFAARKGCRKSSIYLTDEGQNEILMAL